VVDLGIVGAQFTWGSGWDVLSSIANLTGSTHGDILRGSTAANEIRDLLGDDRVLAGAGNDTVFAGGGGADTYDGEGGSDLISFEEGTGPVVVNLAAGTASGWGIFFDTVLNFEHVRGGTGADTITGGAGANRLEGAAGNDILSGGAGNDTLVGGAGADQFVFGMLSGTDRIEDFELGLDVIRFTSGPQSFADLTFGAANTISANGTTIHLVGASTAALSAADFVFG
jgi:Ca2+-binding RTX toxin-like protein